MITSKLCHRVNAPLYLKQEHHIKESFKFSPQNVALHSICIYLAFCMQFSCGFPNHISRKVLFVIFVDVPNFWTPVGAEYCSPGCPANSECQVDIYSGYTKCLCGPGHYYSNNQCVGKHTQQHGQDYICLFIKYY